MKLTDIILLLLTLPIVAAPPNGESTILLWAGAEPSADASFAINIPGQFCPGDQLDYSSKLSGAINKVDYKTVLEMDETVICSTETFSEVNFHPPMVFVPDDVIGGSGDIEVSVPWDWSKPSIERGNTSGNGSTIVTLNYNAHGTNDRIRETGGDEKPINVQVPHQDILFEVEGLYKGLTIDALEICNNVVKAVDMEISKKGVNSKIAARLRHEATVSMSTVLKSAGANLSSINSAQSDVYSRLSMNSAVSIRGVYTYCPNRRNDGRPGWNSNSSITGGTRREESPGISLNFNRTVSASVPGKKILFFGAGSVSISVPVNAGFLTSGTVSVEIINKDEDPIYASKNSPTTTVTAYSETNYKGDLSLKSLNNVLGGKGSATVDSIINNPPVILTLIAE